LYASRTITEKTAGMPLPVSRGYSIDFAALQNGRVVPSAAVPSGLIGITRLRG
jgi:hypothetical protein